MADRSVTVPMTLSDLGGVRGFKIFWQTFVLTLERFEFQTDGVEDRKPRLESLSW